MQVFAGEGNLCGLSPEGLGIVQRHIYPGDGDQFGLQALTEDPGRLIPLYSGQGASAQGPVDMNMAIG
jgi:hypothetical protein